MVIVVSGCGVGCGNKFRNRNFPVGAKNCFFEIFCELRAQCSVKKGDTTINFAASGIVKGVVPGTW